MYSNSVRSIAFCRAIKFLPTLGLPSEFRPTNCVIRTSIPIANST